MENSIWGEAIAEAEQPADTAETTASTEAPTPPATIEATSETQTTGDVETSDTPAREETKAPEAETEKTPETEKSDLDQEIEERKAKDGDNWAIRGYRELHSENKRLRADAQIAEGYRDPSIPVHDVLQSAYDMSNARFEALIHEVGSLYGDRLAEQRYGLPDAEIRRRIELAKPAKSQATQPHDDQPSDYNPLDDPLLDDFIKDRLRNEEQLKAKLATFDEVNRKVTSFEEAENRRAVERHAEQAGAIKTELVSSVTKVVDEEIKEYGLAVSEQDPQEIKTLKRTIERILRDDMPRAFDSVEENKKAITRALAHADNLERDNAFREEDRLKVATRNTLRTLKEREDVRHLFSTLEQLSKTRAARINGRGKAQPPIPGSTGAGAPLTPQQVQGATIGQMWDQIEGEARAPR